MVDLSKLLQQQRQQAAAPTETPTVEKQEDVSHGQGRNSPDNGIRGSSQSQESDREGRDSGTSASGNRSSDSGKSRSIAGGFAGLKLGAGHVERSPQVDSQHPAVDVRDPDPVPDPVGTHSGSDGAPDPAPQRVTGLAGLKLNAAKPSSILPDAPPTGATTTAAGPVDSLEALAKDESTGSPTIESISGFPDEIPATAPDREVPDDLSDEAKNFVQSLDSMYEVLNDPELFGQMIRSIMMELQNNPQYSKLICDDDVMVMIRGMRESMGLARIRKEAKKKSTPSGSRKSVAKNDEVFDDLAALAGSMGMSFDQ